MEALFQRYIISCTHSFRMGHGSSRSSQSIPSALSKLVLWSVVLVRRLKAFFQGIVEFIAISFSAGFEKGAIGLVLARGISSEPPPVMRRIKVRSTSSRGVRRILTFNSSDDKWPETFFALWGDVCSEWSYFWARSMASSIKRMDWTTLSWMTALHEARSARNDCVNQLVVLENVGRTAVAIDTHLLVVH